MMSESVVVIPGLLMGLNVIDYTVMMKGDEFDQAVSPHCPQKGNVFVCLSTILNKRYVVIVCAKRTTIDQEVFMGK